MLVPGARFAAVIALAPHATLIAPGGGRAAEVRVERTAMPSDWKTYQEDAVAFFRGLGHDAQTDVQLKGVRTTHDVDVVVRLLHVGFDVLWLVECKHWRARVSKLHVLGLREIVTDLGADRGIILSESGFQSGAIEAAALTNVTPTSLAELRRTASHDIMEMRVRDLYDRTEVARKRYWDIPKGERTSLGLRPEAPEVGYSGDQIVQLAEDVLSNAMRGTYPFECDSLQALVYLGGLHTFNGAPDVLKIVEPLITDLEQKLARARK